MDNSFSVVDGIEENRSSHSNNVGETGVSLFRQFIIFNFLFWVILGPLVYVLLAYIVVLAVNVYELLLKIQERLKGVSVEDKSSRLRNLIYILWGYIARIWHGYEISGMENLKGYGKGGALLIYYHGALSIDMMHFMSICALLKEERIKLYCDRFVFKFPGWKRSLTLVGAFTGGYQEVVEALKEDFLVTLSPGGVLEAQFGDNNYRMIWKNRTGFARAALEAKVPIIPVLTENIREAYQTVNFGRSWFRKIYDKWKLPLVLVYGGLPVKLRTIIGDPIPYDPNLTPEELTEKTRRELELLIRRNQRIPGSVTMALLDRILGRKLRSI